MAKKKAKLNQLSFEDYLVKTLSKNISDAIDQEIIDSMHEAHDKQMIEETKKKIGIWKEMK